MSREADRLAIATYLDSVWEDSWGPLGWPNSNFSIPANSRWNIIQILDYNTRRASLSSHYNLRHDGGVQIDMYIPEGQGTKPIRVTADALFDLFNEITLPTTDGSSLQFRTPEFRTPSDNEIRAANLDDNWYRYTMTVQFRKDKFIGN